MRTTKFSSIAIAMLMTSLCLFLIVNINVSVYANNVSSILKVDSGPRNIFQLMTSVTVVQQNPELLQVSVVRKSDEVTVYQRNSSAAEICISTQGWANDDYTVHTNCEHNDYQVFYFTIE